MAERVGFEPTLEFPLNTLSKRAPSTTRPSLPGACNAGPRHARFDFNTHPLRLAGFQTKPLRYVLRSVGILSLSLAHIFEKNTGLGSQEHWIVNSLLHERPFYLQPFLV
jgi:hypothetical protein